MPRIPIPIVPNLFPNLWFLPCNETPFPNRNHPVFLAIKDGVIAIDENRICFSHLGWVTPDSCCRTHGEAEEQLFFQFEKFWIDKGFDKVTTPNTLEDYFQHSKLNYSNLPWFNINSLFREGHHATSD